MPEPCFVKSGSKPPVCGVHNVRLVQRQSSEDSDASKFGRFAFSVCPVSGKVLNDEGKHKLASGA
jgi:hypothetical protein